MSLINAVRKLFGVEVYCENCEYLFREICKYPKNCMLVKIEDGFVKAPRIEWEKEPKDINHDGHCKWYELGAGVHPLGGRYTLKTKKS